MITLKGDKLYLRQLEPEDLSFLYQVENNENLWFISNTQTPYSKFILRQYLENAKMDIYEAKQLRLAICLYQSETPIGLIDLFDFDPKNKRAGLGIVIQNEKDRAKNFGKEALSLLLNYAFFHLDLHQIYANIDANNLASIKLFTTFGFEKIGTKKEWNYQNGNYFDENLYQLINYQVKK